VGTGDDCEHGTGRAGTTVRPRAQREIYVVMSGLMIGMLLAMRDSARVLFGTQPHDLGLPMPAAPDRPLPTGIDVGRWP